MKCFFQSPQLSGWLLLFILMFVQVKKNCEVIFDPSLYLTLQTQTMRESVGPMAKHDPNLITPHLLSRFSLVQRCPLWAVSGRQPDHSSVSAAPTALASLQCVLDTASKALSDHFTPLFGILRRSLPYRGRPKFPITAPGARQCSGSHHSSDLSSCAPPGRAGLPRSPRVSSAPPP